LTRLGFRKIFVDRIWDSFLIEKDLRDEFPPPDPYLLGWTGVGRFLAQSEFIREFRWNPKGTFLLFQDQRESGPAGGTLVAFSNSRETLDFDLWTGDKLRGKDLLETERRISYDEDTAKSFFKLGPVPIFLAPFPSGRVETAMSVRRVSDDLKPYPLTQRLSYEVVNHMDRRVDMHLEPPPDGWIVRDRVTSATSLLPGEKRLWSWDVDLPQPPPLLRSLVFRVRVHMNDGDQYEYVHEDLVPLGSDVVELEIEPHGHGARAVRFRLRNVRKRPVRLNVFARLFGESPVAHNLDRITLPASGVREMSVPLNRPLSEFSGEDIWIGFQVGGRGEYNTYVFEVAVGEDQVILGR
jgi:hypothetical protein